MTMERIHGRRISALRDEDDKERVGAIIDRAVRLHGDKICTNFLGKPLTYADIGRQIDRAAPSL